MRERRSVAPHPRGSSQQKLSRPGACCGEKTCSALQRAASQAAAAAVVARSQKSAETKPFAAAAGHATRAEAAGRFPLVQMGRAGPQGSCHTGWAPAPLAFS